MSMVLSTEVNGSTTMKFSPGLQFIREILAVKKKERKIRNNDGILYLTPSGQITNVLAIKEYIHLFTRSILLR